METLINLLNNKKIVITGASGYIGFSLYNELKKLSKNIIPTTRDKNLLKLDKNFKKAQYNKNSFWDDLIDYADIIYHLSADTSLDESKKDLKKNYRNNILPVNIFINEALKKKKNINFIFTSSVTVCGLSTNKIITEKIKPIPCTIYDKNKLINENNLINISKKENYINSTIMRLSNVYGYSISNSSNKKRGFLNQVMYNALRGNDIYIYGNGKFYRDYIHINDVISALKRVTFEKKCKSNIYNIATGKSFYLIDVVKKIITEAYKITNKKSKIKIIPFPKNIKEIEKRNYRISSNKINKLNWKPEFSIKKGIQNSLNKFYINGKY